MRGDVGDRVPHPVAATWAAGEVHRLVQVPGGGGVDRDERDVGAVDGRLRRCRSRLVCFTLGVGRELLGQAELAAQRAEVDAGREYASDDHGSILTAPPVIRFR